MNADDGCSELHVFRVCLLILVRGLMVTVKNNRATSQARLISSWGRFSSNNFAETLILCSHEFTGTVEEIGSEVKNFKKGDQIVSPFTVSWYVFSFGIQWHCIDWSRAWNAFTARTAIPQDVRNVSFLAQPHWMEHKQNM